MSRPDPLHIFAGFGLEMEYMIVDRETLQVRPLTDYVLTEIAGACVSEVEVGALAWSNELVMHVIELKTNGPAARLAGLENAFLADVRRINGILASKGAMLMPTAMHPLMDPATDTKLWELGNAEIYAAYNRIFDCRGHGWSNLQSVHINLPFAGDDEFGRLHAAIRLILPILPALAASSPIYAGKASGFMDSRLEFYRHNQRAVPSITGGVIPERVYSRKDYEEQIFARIYADIAPHDPAGILQDEWLNSRGAIARFDRDAIEIRLLDIQESPRMDLAVVATVVSVVQALADEVFLPLAAQQAWSEDPLRSLFVACVKDGSEAVIADADYLALFGLAPQAAVTAGALWAHLVAALLAKGGYPLAAHEEDVQALVKGGCLARRILLATGPKPTSERVKTVYAQLCRVLAAGGYFDGEV